jgi:hypothetical protein
MPVVLALSETVFFVVVPVATAAHDPSGVSARDRLGVLPIYIKKDSFLHLGNYPLLCDVDI